MQMTHMAQMTQMMQTTQTTQTTQMTGRKQSASAWTSAAMLAQPAGGVCRLVDGA
jgi:hypothetical protein